MSKDPKWLDEMMDAALIDFSDSVTEPDFQVIRQASPGVRSFSRFRRQRTLITAAAVLLAASLALPVGIIAGRRITMSRLIREQNALFVEELIGGTIFDQGLDSDEPWLFDGSIDEAVSDI